MGASYFKTIGVGDTPEEAFEDLVEEAYYEWGHNGYTGEICEKRSFQMATHETLGVTQAIILAQDLSNKMPYSDKWSPNAGCIKLDDGRWLFFGTSPS